MIMLIIKEKPNLLFCCLEVWSSINIIPKERFNIKKILTANPKRVIEFNHAGFFQKRRPKINGRRPKISQPSLLIPLLCKHYVFMLDMTCLYAINIF